MQVQLLTGAANVITLDWGAIVGIATLIGMCIGVVAWFIRLESEVKFLKIAHDNHKLDVQAKQAAFDGKVDTFQKTMNDVLQGLGKIEGKLETQNAR